jgi:hypothetical protein
MTSQRDSGREKGISAEDLPSLGVGTNPHWAPIGGVGIPGRVNRGKTKGYHTSYMPHEATHSYVENASWPISDGTYNPWFLAELYDPAFQSIEPAPLEECFNLGPDPAFLDMVLEGYNPPHNQPQGAYSHRLHSESTHGHYMNGPEPMESPNLPDPNWALGSPIKTLPSHAKSPADCRDSRHYRQDVSSTVSVSRVRPNLAVSNRPHASEIYPAASTRRTRRPNTCDICGKEVRRPGVLEDHINSHTGQRRG